MKPTRRECLAGLPAAALLAPATGGAIVIDPKPQFDISPHLYMQFMEPLGVSDSSVEAAWDYDSDDWRKDFIDVVKDLAPGAVRWGGNFTRYYKWREGVGPVAARPWMRNYSWGGKETNRVGTDEFLSFCQRVGAAPLICVNFLSDGRKRFGERTGDAREAAEWVSYAAPRGVKLWQIGNETSYGDDGFTKEQAVAHTVEFAKAMKQRDPSISLIGWGDKGRGQDRTPWAKDMLQGAGEYLDYVALHMMGQAPKRRDTVLRGLEYQKEPERAWQELMEMAADVESRITEIGEIVGRQSPKTGIAVTEGHLSLSPHNTNPILFEWLTGVFHARCLNTYQRHGGRIRIATAADFAGTRWTVNAVMIPVPRGRSYLMPVGSVARLFKKHNGTQGALVRSSPPELDIAASREGNRIFLHVANMSYGKSVEASFAVNGASFSGGRVFEIAPESPRAYVNQDQPRTFEPREKPLPAGLKWSFPPASVTAVELTLS